jgi:hypothetical protein
MKHSKSAAVALLAIVVSAVSGAGLAAQSVCESASPLLSGAGGCAVFQLAARKVAMSHGDPTGMDGDLCMVSGSELSMSGGQIITGTAYLEPGVRYPRDILERAGAVDFAADLSAEILAATDAAGDLADLTCDVTLPSLKISSSAMMDVRDIVPGGGQAVICVAGNMEVKGSGTSLLLSGQAGDSFVFNVGGSFKVNGAKIFTVDGLTPSDVVYNIVGTGADVAFSGGGGGLGCCKAAIEGTLLAPERKIALSPGKVTGQVISGRDIALASGSLVVCPPGSRLGTIGDRVWFDDPNIEGGALGRQDPGEQGIEGVEVSLFDAGSNLLATTTTIDDGIYQFTGLPEGRYTVVLDTELVGLLQATYDYDGLGTLYRATADLASAEVNLAVDFGFMPTR